MLKDAPSTIDYQKHEKLTEISCTYDIRGRKELAEEFEVY
jgi:hypothetical protein